MFGILVTGKTNMIGHRLDILRKNTYEKELQNNNVDN